MNNIYFYMIQNDKPFLIKSRFPNEPFSGIIIYDESEIEKHFNELSTKDILVCPNIPYCEKAINDSLLSFVLLFLLLLL